MNLRQGREGLTIILCNLQGPSPIARLRKITYIHRRDGSMYVYFMAHRLLASNHQTQHIQSYTESSGHALGMLTEMSCHYNFLHVVNKMPVSKLNIDESYIKSNNLYTRPISETSMQSAASQSSMLPAHTPLNIKSHILQLQV
jgi:hypothetical protein